MHVDRDSPRIMSKEHNVHEMVLNVVSSITLSLHNSLKRMILNSMTRVQYKKSKSKCFEIKYWHGQPLTISSNIMTLISVEKKYT